MDDDTDELVPPSAARVAARAITLCVVSCRGFIDQDAAQAGDFWTRVRDWHGSLDIDDELEPRERSLLETPLGQLSPQQRAEASWLCEGMVVLAWALRCRTLPAHDETIVAAEVADTLGFLEPASKTVLHDPRLRPSEELHAYGDVI